MNDIDTGEIIEEVDWRCWIGRSPVQRWGTGRHRTGHLRIMWIHHDRIFTFQKYRTHLPVWSLRRATSRWGPWSRCWARTRRSQTHRSTAVISFFFRFLTLILWVTFGMGDELTSNSGRNHSANTARSPLMCLTVPTGARAKNLRISIHYVETESAAFFNPFTTRAISMASFFKFESESFYVCTFRSFFKQFLTVRGGFECGRKRYQRTFRSHKIERESRNLTLVANSWSMDSFENMVSVPWKNSISSRYWSTVYLRVSHVVQVRVTGGLEHSIDHRRQILLGHFIPRELPELLLLRVEGDVVLQVFFTFFAKK